MRYIQQQLGFEDDSTVASVDAMNDLLMLQQVLTHLVHALFSMQSRSAWCAAKLRLQTQLYRWLQAAGRVASGWGETFLLQNTVHAVLVVLSL
jgi:hypothetical protein